MTRSATRPAPSGRASGDRANLYDEITDRIIAELEAGRLPWVQPWGTSGVAAPLALPKNAATSPPPWGAFSYAPLAAVADAYRAAGAEVWNLPAAAPTARRE